MLLSVADDIMRKLWIEKLNKFMNLLLRKKLWIFKEVGSYSDRIYDITYDFEVEYGMEINPVIQSIQTYEQWKNVYPFFINIEKDGVTV